MSKRRWFYDPWMGSEFTFVPPEYEVRVDPDGEWWVEHYQRDRVLGQGACRTVRGARVRAIKAALELARQKREDAGQ